MGASAIWIADAFPQANRRRFRAFHDQRPRQIGTSYRRCSPIRSSMGERGISDEYYGWPYCGAGENNPPQYNNNGDGDNLLSTQAGLSAGAARRECRLSLLELSSDLSQFICVDGSGHVLSYDIDLRTFQGLSTRAGGEIFQLPAGW